ncbi:MAG: NUDIX hydrolase [Leptolyngbyaceae cyanobacterium bins.349]|nr:NUDIX hydrolase [Leptolyngbyaceae cyanobacterium bins.349]
MEHWKTLKSKDLYVAEPWLRLSIEQIELPDGRVIDDYYRIQMQDYVVIFAQVPDGRVILLNQYKHGVGKVSLTLPGGGLIKDEAPLAAAQRELLEETGYVAASWRSLPNFISSANYRCCEGHIFVAEQAQKVAEPNSGDLEEMEVVLLPPEELVQAVQQGQVVVLGALAAIALALNPIFRAT